jgi:hypothetical protein
VIGDDVTLIGAFLRMGRGESVTDNVSSGGIFANIDVDTGIILEAAQGRESNKLYGYHPDTHVQIVGSQIPEWNNLIQRVKAIAKKVKGTTIVGWDMAYSDKGWIMVEGNGDGSLESHQSGFPGGLKPLVVSLMDKYFENK